MKCSDNVRTLSLHATHKTSTLPIPRMSCFFIGRSARFLFQTIVKGGYAMRKRSLRGEPAKIRFVKSHVLKPCVRLAGSVADHKCCCGKTITTNGEFTTFSATPAGGGDSIVLNAGQGCQEKLIEISGSLGRPLQLPPLFSPFKLSESKGGASELTRIAGAAKGGDSTAEFHALNREAWMAIHLILFVYNMQVDLNRLSGRLLRQIADSPSVPIHASNCKSINTFIRKIGHGETLSAALAKHGKNSQNPVRAFTFPEMELKLAALNEQSLL